MVGKSGSPWFNPALSSDGIAPGFDSSGVGRAVRVKRVEKSLPRTVIALIREMNRANPLWGAPRIYGELLKLGLTVAQKSVANYMVPRARRPSSHNWKAFLRNHVSGMVSVDFLTVPTVNFKLLYLFLVLAHHRRRVLHFNVVESPSAAWAAQQLREAFAFTTPRSTCSVTAMAFTAWSSRAVPKLWACRKSELRPARPGSRLTSND